MHDKLFVFLFSITSVYQDVPVLMIAPALTGVENVQEEKQHTHDVSV